MDIPTSFLGTGIQCLSSPDNLLYCTSVMSRVRNHVCSVAHFTIKGKFVNDIRFGTQFIPNVSNFLVVNVGSFLI